MAEGKASGQKLVVAEGCTTDILDDGLATALDHARLQQGREQAAAMVRGGKDQIGHEIVKLEAAGAASDAAAKRRIHAKLLRRHQGERDLGKPAYPHLARDPGEGRVLGAVDSQ